MRPPTLHIMVLLVMSHGGMRLLRRVSIALMMSWDGLDQATCNASDGAGRSWPDPEAVYYPFWWPWTSAALGSPDSATIGGLAMISRRAWPNCDGWPHPGTAVCCLTVTVTRFQSWHEMKFLTNGLGVTAGKKCRPLRCCGRYCCTQLVPCSLYPMSIQQRVV